MVMEKVSPLLVGWEFAPDMLHRFYGRNSSSLADAVYRQKEIHRKVMSRNFSNCHIKILHADAYATLNDGVVVQVLGLLSNNNQALRRFMQMFVLAPEGSVANQFYQDEVFGGFVTEPQEESEEVKRQQTPQVVPDDSGTFCDQAVVSNDVEEHLEEPVAELEPDPEPEPEQECVSEIQEEKSELVLEETAPEDAQKSSSPAPADISQTVREELRTFSWASVTSNNLQPSGAVPVTRIPPYVGKVLASQPCTESKPESQIPPQRPQRDQRIPICEAGEQGDIEPQRVVRHPDKFLSKLWERGGWWEITQFWFCFDDSEPVQKVLRNRPIMFRDEVYDRLRGPGGPLCGLGGGMRGPPRGDMVQKAGFGVGRGLAPWQ
uniref:NTF2 domain-containing protein n=1 Tax=Gorilla gorilla gorilla TaxID=9595 RepID=A0A2I2ZE49_GORGO